MINYLSRSNSNQASGEQIVLLSDSKEQLSDNSGSDASLLTLRQMTVERLPLSIPLDQRDRTQTLTDPMVSPRLEDDDIYSVLADDVNVHWA